MSAGLSLHEAFMSGARLRPSAPFLTFRGSDAAVHNWSYEAFGAVAQDLVRILHDLGLGRGDRILVALPNHPAVVALLLAGSATGCVVVLIDPRSSVREQAYAWELTTPAASIGISWSPVPTRRKVAIDLAVGPAVSLVARAREQRRQTGPPSSSVPDALELLFTSGSTSQPKAVILTNAAVRYGADVFVRAAGISADDRQLIVLPLHHAAAQCHQLWPTVMAGASIVLLERFSASRFFADARTFGATTSALFAAPLRMLLARGDAMDARRSGLRNITFAQRLTSDEFESWHARFGVPLQHLWGMTETVGLPVMSPLAGDRRLIAMGRPVVGYDVRVVDDDAQPVPPGVPGQLVVRAEPGANVMLGYYRDDADTARAIHGGWLWTGDTVLEDADGFIHFVGRSQDIIRRGGENVSSLEIEDALRSVPGVRDVAVVGVPDPVLDERVAALVVRDPSGKLNEERLLEMASRVLAPPKRPEIVRFVDDLPRTSVGKVQRDLVRKTLQEA